LQAAEEFKTALDATPNNEARSLNAHAFEQYTANIVALLSPAQAKLPSQLPTNPELPTPPAASDVTLSQAATVASFPGAAGDHVPDQAQARGIELLVQGIVSFPPSASVTEHRVPNPPPENLGQLLAHPQP
jgi:hypothetical protein